MSDPQMSDPLHERIEFLEHELARVTADLNGVERICDALNIERGNTQASRVATLKCIIDGWIDRCKTVTAERDRLKRIVQSVIDEARKEGGE